MKPKLLLKLEQIARLRLFSGMTDVAIQSLLNMSQGGLSRIIALPEYIEIEKRLAAGNLQELDIALAGKTKEMRDAFAPLVPAAMRALQEAVLQRRDLKTAIAASREILNRDPNATFVETSKGISPQASLPANVLAAAQKTASSIPSASHVVVIQQPDRNSN